MNINGYGEVTAIRFTHKGFEMNMENILPAAYMKNPPTKPSTITFFEFNDISEIEMMIRMLEEFKGICTCGIGYWKRY